RDRLDDIVRERSRDRRLRARRRTAALGRAVPPTWLDAPERDEHRVGSFGAERSAVECWGHRLRLRLPCGRLRALAGQPADQYPDDVERPRIAEPGSRRIVWAVRLSDHGRLLSGHQRADA